MRTIVIGSCFLGAVALGLGACGDSSSGGKEAPAPSASTAAAPSAAASASAKAENDKPKKTEAPKDHKARLHALVEAWASHDAKKVGELYAADAVWKRVGMPDAKGRDAIEKQVAADFAAFKDVNIVPGRVWERDKHLVVTEWTLKGTSTGDAPDMGIPKATNKPFGVVGASLMMVGDDGLIKEEHTYLDTPTLVGQVTDEKKLEKVEEKKGHKEKVEEKKELAVRPIVTGAPEGSMHYEASTAEKDHGDKTADTKGDKDKPATDKAKEDKGGDAKLAELEKKNVDEDQKLTAELTDKKIDEAAKSVADDVAVIDYTEKDDVKGKKAWKDLYHMYATAFPDMKMKVGTVFGDHEFVVGEFEGTGTQKGALGPIKPTNKPVDIHMLSVDEFKDGKLVKSWSWGNSAEMLSELGVMKDEKKDDKKGK